MNSGLLTSWNWLLAEIPAHRRDVYFTEEYIRLYEASGNRAVCFYYREGAELFLFPYLERRFWALGRECFDFETAYGYGGPVSTSDNPAFCASAWHAFVNLVCAKGYVAGFVRFHPLLRNESLCPRGVEIIPERYTVAMDLSGTVKDIWLDEIHTKNRNVIKKAVKNGLSFTADYEYRNYDEFKNLYAGTMDRLRADSFYYFSPEYFEKFKNGIRNSFLGLVKVGQKTVAAAIFMYDSHYGHYHLSGSDKTMLNLNPNNLLLWGAAQELKSNGVELFHLGGGTDSAEDNSLLGFKRKFSRSLFRFHLGKIIFNQDIYRELCRIWEAGNTEKASRYNHIFLKYKY